MISNLTVVNLVISTHLSESITFAHITCSNHELCYEPELFPALFINRWLPVHVAIFHNGKVIITGLKSETQVSPMLDSITDYLHTHKLVK